MGLLGDIVGGVFKIGWGLGKEIISQAWGQAQEADRVRRNSRGMSDQDLINGIKNTSNSVGTRAGYAQAYKDRHRR